MSRGMAFVLDEPIGTQAPGVRMATGYDIFQRRGNIHPLGEHKYRSVLYGNPVLHYSEF